MDGRRYCAYLPATSVLLEGDDGLPVLHVPLFLLGHAEESLVWRGKDVKTPSSEGCSEKDMEQLTEGMALTCRRATDSSFLCSAFLALYMWKVAWILVAALRMILNFFLILYLRLKSDKLMHALGLGERGAPLRTISFGWPQPWRTGGILAHLRV